MIGLLLTLLIPKIGCFSRKWSGIILMLWCSYCSSESPGPLLQSRVSTELHHSHNSAATYMLLERGIREFLLSENMGHNHSFYLSNEEFLSLKLGVSLEIYSSEDQLHSHLINIQIMDE